MNTKDLVESLNEIAVNDLSEGANIVDHPAHIAAIELIGLDVMRADVRRLTEENAKLKREVDMAEKQSLDFYVEKENAAEREAMLEQLKKQLEDRITLPTVPPEGLLLSMAIRFDHGLGVQGYYDDPMFGPPSHQKRLESTIRTMNQLYEEVSGGGFFTYPIPQDKGSEG